MEDLGLKWDLIKIEMRGFTMKYSKNKGKKRKSTEINLQNQINKLYKKAEKQPNNKQIINEIYYARTRLKNIMQLKTKGTILRSKLNGTSTGKETQDGSFINDQSKILQEQMRFYKTLYTSGKQRSSI